MLVQEDPYAYARFIPTLYCESEGYRAGRPVLHSDERCPIGSRIKPEDVIYGRCGWAVRCAWCLAFSPEGFLDSVC